MCNLEGGATYGKDGFINGTAIQHFPDRAHCLKEVAYVGGAGSYNPGSKAAFVSLQPIRVQNRENSNYTPAFTSFNPSYSMAPAQGMSSITYAPQHIQQPSDLSAFVTNASTGYHMHNGVCAH